MTINLRYTGRREEEFARVLEEYFEIWKKRRRQYGSGDPAEAATAHSCVIRLSNDLQRLWRFYFEIDGGLGNEPIADTWIDMIGVAALGFMAERDAGPNA